MQGNLEDEGGKPGHEQQAGIDPQTENHRIGRRPRQPETAEQLQNHHWRHDGGRASRVFVRIVGETSTHELEKRVMDDLDKPDHAGHEQGRGTVQKEDHEKMAPMGLHLPSPGRIRVGGGRSDAAARLAAEVPVRRRRSMPRHDATVGGDVAPDHPTTLAAEAGNTAASNRRGR